MTLLIQLEWAGGCQSSETAVALAHPQFFEEHRSFFLGGAEVSVRFRLSHTLLGSTSRHRDPSELVPIPLLIRRVRN